MTIPTIPEAPSGDSFSARDNVNALVAIKVLRVDKNWPDRFNDANPGGTTTATLLDVWVLDGSPQRGTFLSNCPNTSLLGSQLASGVGTTFYGRIAAQKRSSGTAYILGDPWPNDMPTIEGFRAKYEAGQVPGSVPARTQASTAQPHQYQNEPAWQDPAPAPAAAPAPAQASAQPGYTPPAFGAPAVPAAPTNDDPPF